MRREVAERQRLQDLLRDAHLFAAIAIRFRGERDANGVADPFLQQDRERGGTRHDTLHAHAGFGEAQVQWVVVARGEQAVHVHQVLHVRHLGTEHDPVVSEADLFGEQGGADRRLDHGIEHHVARLARDHRRCVRVHQAGEQCLVERSPVDANAHRLVVLQGDVDDGAEVLVVALATHVARIDAVLGERLGAVGMSRQQQVPVVVEVADDRDHHTDAAKSGDDPGHRRRRRIVVDGDAHQLAAGAREQGHLCHGCGDIGGVGVGHRLNHHRVRRAHRNAAHHDRRRWAAGNRGHQCSRIRRVQAARRSDPTRRA